MLCKETDAKMQVRLRGGFYGPFLSLLEKVLSLFGLTFPAFELKKYSYYDYRMIVNDITMRIGSYQYHLLSLLLVLLLLCLSLSLQLPVHI